MKSIAKEGEGTVKNSPRKNRPDREVICPLSSRQVKYLKLDVDDACISF